MASVDFEPQTLLEPARKRVKLSSLPSQDPAREEGNTMTNSMSTAQEAAHSIMMAQREREAQAGILYFVNDSNPGFSGILKQRYTDFLVNEVTLDGKVIHLTDTAIPQIKAASKPPPRSPPQTSEAVMEVEQSILPKAEATISKSLGEVSKPVIEDRATNLHSPDNFTLSSHDTALLDAYFGATVRNAILNLYEKVLLNPLAKPGSLGLVSSEPITDRQLRSKLHEDMRRIFNSSFETVTGADDVVTIKVAQKNKQQGRLGHGENIQNNGRNQQLRGRPGWQELGGEHLHFSLYKENKDTMEVISFIASQIRTSPKQFSFAGTKDRRGVTVQRISVYRVHANALTSLNRILRGSKVGNFSYEKTRLELGDLMGNEFLITLRDCTFTGSDIVEGGDKAALAEKVIREAVENMQAHGFINYYGLQRFGTYAVGTHDVGLKILQGDFEGAVNAILAYSEDALACALEQNFVPADGKLLPRDDIARAGALHIFKTTGDSQTALDKLPRKFSGEASILRYMKRNKRDFLGALLQIPRNLRLMYVHAYQSLVWNMAASERWTRYGDKVVKGDLILVDSESMRHIESVKENELDENGEIIVLPSAGDAAVSYDDLWERARTITAEEVASGKYTIFDIVLPTPGYDIEYPDNDVGDYYKEFMMSERGGGLDPGNMRRAQQDFSLSGSYRKLLATIGRNVTYEIKLYSDDNEQMVETDLEKMTKSRVNFGSSAKDSRSGGARDNGSDWRQRQQYGNRDIRQNHFENLDTEKHAKQLQAWRNLPLELAEKEKAEVALFEAKLAADLKLPKLKLAQPAYKETFIQRSEDGKRTGYRQETLLPGVIVDAPETSMGPVKVATVDGDGCVDGVTEVQAKPMEDLKDDLPTDAPTSALTSDGTQIDAGLDSNVKGEQKKEAADEIPGEALIEDAVSEKTKAVQEKIAVIVKFQLGSSQYATMALRELMKQGGVQTFKPEFGSRR